MSLHPAFFQMPRFNDSRSSPPKAEDVGWRVIGFSRSGEFTLVRWAIAPVEAEDRRQAPKRRRYERVQFVQSFFEGETLYYGQPPEHRQLANAYGRLVLYADPNKINTIAPRTEKRVPVWDRPHWAAGKHGISAAIARALHDPRNYNPIEIEE